MIPIITSLISSLEVSDDFYLYEEESDNETIISDSEEIKQQTELNYDNITEILKNVKKSIYISLKHYWAISNEFDIIAAFLDPRYKNLNFISDSNIKERIQTTLKAQYDQLKWKINQQSISPSPILTSIENSTTNTKSLHDHQARHEKRIK